MTGLRRRNFALGALALPLLAQSVQADTLVEVIGSAIIHGPSDIDAARRRALADALLSAALAGGAAVQGHSAMSMARMTSDVLIVRPLGRVLRFEVLAQQQSGQYWQVRIRARVGPPMVGHCHDRRALVLTVYPPEVRVAPEAPAWAETLAHQIVAELIRQTQQRPEVAELVLAGGLPGADPARDQSSWRSLTQGSNRVAPGGHGLQMRLSIAPQNRQLMLALQLRLEGPAQEQMLREHLAEIRLPGPSLLGRTAPPALQALMRDAGCQPVRAVIRQEGGVLAVSAGRVHGLTRAALAFTTDRDHSVEMLEITALSDRQVRLSPLDPTRSPASFAGRSVRFLDTAQGLR